MKSNIYVLLLSTIMFFGFSTTAFAQLSGWTQKVPVTINENRGESGANYVMFIDINTQQYVTAGQMLANGNDIRFSADCNGTQQFPYWIESGMNTTSTRIWVRLPQLVANTANEVVMFMGNPSAPAGSSQAGVFVNTLVVSTNTTLAVGTYNYDWFEVQNGVTLTITGNNADIFQVNAGKIVVNGTINGNGAGFTGGQGTNGNGPGGGSGTQISGGQPATGGGGGAYGGDGGDGGYDIGEPLPVGGTTYGNSTTLDIQLGSGGGGSDATLPFGALGGNGGAGIYLKGFDINVSSGTINANGNNGGMGNALRGSGGGSGGGVLLQGERVNFNTININAIGGNGGTGSGNDDGGGGGGGGRIKLFYYNFGISNLAGINMNMAGGTGGCCGSQASGQDGVDGTISAQNPAGAFTVSAGGVVNHYTLTIAGEDTVCLPFGGGRQETYQVNVIPGFSYTWQVSGGTIVSGQGTNIVTINWTVNGTHQLILTDNSGACTISDTLPVVVNSLFNFAFGSQTPSCAGEPTYFDMPPGAFNPSFSYVWDFGDSTTATGFNQNHIYQNPGSYQVQFVVTNQFGCTGTSIFNINVPAKPTPNFTFTQPTCPGGTVTFTNTSTNATSYIWDFGDGDSSTVANPTHAYATAGTYTVTLTAISTSACNASTTKSVTISANPSPNLVVTGDSLACEFNTFSYGSNISSGATILWELVPALSGNILTGHGTNNIQVEWTSGGNNFVKVTATDPATGCFTTDSLAVVVNNSYVFAFANVSDACAGEPTFFQNPAGAFNPGYTYLWEFGDSNISNTFNPTHIYQNPGTYSIRLQVTNEFNCTGTSIFSHTVPAKPTPSFTFTQPTCPGGTVTFTNTSTNATTYEWNFGDGNTSTAANPTHSYPTAGTYTVTLRAIATADCDAVTTQSVTISANPVPNFSVSGDTLACTNLNEIYSTNIGGGNTITWALSSGGSIVSGQGTNAIEVDWTTVGSHFVRVTATSPDGCTTSDSLQVDVDNVVNVAIPTNTNACEGEVTQFNANTPATGGPYTFFWNFGDGATSTDENPFHIFATAGTYNVTLALTSPTNCTGTSTTNVVVPAKPVADFTATPACPGADVTFTNNSTNATTYEWSFGDGATSTVANPTHAYTVAGTYTVTLRAISTANCDDVISRSVTVSPRPSVDFAATSACPDSLVTFTNLSTVSSGTITTYAWNFGDGNISSLANPTHAYTAAGTYEVTLVATTNIGCQDSIKRNVTVYAAPVAGFTANAPVCDDSLVVFTNTSSITTGTLSYVWNFGDGNTSTNINPTHTYAGPGTYTVTLAVASNNGCVDTATLSIVVNPRPTASFTASATTICLGDTIDFTSTGTTGAGVITGWDFGDGNQALIEDTSYVYTTTGTFKVTLLVADPLSGCFDTTSVLITVNEEPTAAFTFSDVCDGTAVNFTNQSTIPVGTLSHLWNFGDGNTSTNINPSHTYGAPGTYSVLLTVTSNNGCEDTLTQQVTVFPEPTASFTLNSETACDRDTVFLTNTSVTVGSDIEYTWNFGDGNTSNDVSPTYVYGGPGIYTITLTVTDTITGCTDVANDTVTIFHRAVPAFTVADVCIGTAASFTNNTTIGVGTVSYFWDFGDTTFSTDINPTHVYGSIGIKTVTLIATTNNGCSDTTTRTLIVHPEPVSDFSVGPTCFGNPTEFTNLTTIAFGNNTYLWNFGDGVTSTDSNATHTYNVLGNYTVTLTATSNAGCTHTSSQVITVHPNPTANFTRANVCEDDAVFFDNTSSIPYGTLTSFWEFGDGFTSIDDNPSYTYTGFGDFNVTLISTSNHGCADTITKSVTIYPKPIVQFDVENVCIGTIVEFDNISAVPGSGTIADIKWFFGDGAVSLETSPRHLYAQPGIYQAMLVVTSTQGCIDTLVKTVVVHDLPSAAIQALGPLAFCDGGSVTLSAPSGQAGYLWSTGETTQTITVSTSGTYSVTVTSQFNCTNNSSIEVTVWQLPFANAGNDTTISKGYTAQLNGSGGVQYEWTPAETLSDGSIANPIAKPLETTTYTLLVTDINGCQDTDEVTVFINEDYLVEATNTLTPNGDGKNDFWYIINIETYPDVEVLIFDRWGTQVYESKAYDNTWDGTYKDSKLPEGTYYYVIRFEGSDRLYKGAVNILR